MKYFALIFLLGCSKAHMELKPGDCVLGRGMALMQLLREGDGKYMFIQYPLQPAVGGEKIDIVEDLSTYKKVKCHTPQ